MADENLDDIRAVDFAFIEKIEWMQGELIITFLQQKRDTKGWPDLEASFQEVVIAFGKVRSLNLNISEPSLFQIMGLQISNISANGWEDINYKVEDYEVGNIGFYCKEITLKYSEPYYGILEF